MDAVGAIVEVARHASMVFPVTSRRVAYASSARSIEAGPQVTISTSPDGTASLGQWLNLITTLVTYDAMGRLIESTRTVTGTRYDVIA